MKFKWLAADRKAFDLFWVGNAVSLGGVTTLPRMPEVREHLLNVRWQ